MDYFGRLFGYCCFFLIINHHFIHFLKGELSFKCFKSILLLIGITYLLFLLYINVRITKMQQDLNQLAQQMGILGGFLKNDSR